MIRVIVVADSGAALATLTTAVATVPGAYIVRHGSSTKPIDALVAPLAPDLVVIGDLSVPEHALARLAEVHRAAPAAQVVVCSSEPEAGWLADALRADAAAVLPGALEPHVLAEVLREVLAERTGSALGPTPVPATQPTCAGVPGRRRARPAATLHVGTEKGLAA